MKALPTSCLAERGWALVSVLWFLAMLSLMAAATQELALTSARGENRTMWSARMDGVLEAGVIEALLSVTAKDPSARWRVDGTIYPLAFDGIGLVASVQDEGGRFDLNNVDVTTLTTLLRSAGESDENAQALADSILNWRGIPSLGALHGATDDDYSDAGRSYRQRHGPFQSVDELRLVLGMSPALFAKIRPALTVYTKRSIADAATAPPQVLSVLYDGDQEQVDEIVASRASGGNTCVACLDPVLGTSGHTLTISVRAAVDGRSFSRTEIVQFTGNPARPYLVLAFQ